MVWQAPSYSVHGSASITIGSFSYTKPLQSWQVSHEHGIHSSTHEQGEAPSPQPSPAGRGSKDQGSGKLSYLTYGVPPPWRGWRKAQANCRAMPRKSRTSRRSSPARSHIRRMPMRLRSIA